MKFRDHLESLPSDRRDAIVVSANELLSDIRMSALREAALLSQAEIAMKLGMSQPAVSKLEGRADMLISTFQKYITAVGGTLSISVAMRGATFTFGSISEAMGVATVSSLHPRAYALGSNTGSVTDSEAAPTIRKNVIWIREKSGRSAQIINGDVGYECTAAA